MWPISWAITEATAVLASEPAFGPAMPAQPGADGKTVMIQAGALVDPTEAVRAAERIHDDIGALSNDTDGAAITVAVMALSSSPEEPADATRATRGPVLPLWPTFIVAQISHGGSRGA